MKCKKCKHELQQREGYITNHEQTIWYCPKCRERNYFEEQNASEHSELSDGLSADLVRMLDILNTSIEHRDAPPVDGPVHRKVISLLEELGREPTAKAGGR